MRGTHGWAEIDAERKREILRAIGSRRATLGPSHVELDITDRCNVACYFCNQQDVRTKQQISYEHLAKLIDELARSGVRSVRMSGGGDPLAHRDVGRVLDRLHERGIILDNLTTNGALLDADLARRLTEHRAREVIFSVNAADAQDYARMMRVVPATLTRVVANIKDLIGRRGDSSHPAVVVQFLLDRENFHRLPEMYDLGRSMRPDRIAVGLVFNIPGERIDPRLLLNPTDGESLRPFLEEVLRRDRDAQLLQMYFSVHEWNAMVADMKRRLNYPAETPLFPTASSFQEKNGHCFFGWYTATVRGNGDLYPCCLLMFPDYKPMGNALEGTFADHWNGPAFQRLRQEQRQVLIDGDSAKYDPAKHRVIRSQCVEHGACWLKNLYFRGDEAFYRELGKTLETLRRRSRRVASVRRAAARARAVLEHAARRARNVGSHLRDRIRRPTRAIEGPKPPN